MGIVTGSDLDRVLEVAAAVGAGAGLRLTAANGGDRRAEGPFIGLRYGATIRA